MQYKKLQGGWLPLIAVLMVLPLFAQSQRSPTPSPAKLEARVSVVARGLNHPWGMVFLPDGRMLVTERAGHLRVVSKDGSVSEPLKGVPNVFTEGQGGLLDVALDPQFDRNRWVYFSYAEPGENGTAGTAVARGRFADDELEDVEVIYQQEPKVRHKSHFGSRLVFSPDGMLFITQGERFDFSEQAQDLSSLLGKIVRISPDGSIPDDNPFADRGGTRREIWSYGHRNVQSAAIDPASGQLWTVEHGAMGGDELNRIERGKNYGWPVISYGVHYNGQKIGEGTAKAGMEQPVYYWDPVIAPSGMAIYKGNAFEGWRGSILIGSLKPGGLVRLTMKNGRVAGEQRYLADLGERIREVEEGPDGSIYLLTDDDNGQILRIEPLTRGDDITGSR